MKKLTLLVVPFVAVFAAQSCSPAEGLCQKEFDCQAELELDLEDDYVAVCKAGLEGENNRLRQNAEKPCEDLANAAAALATCEAVLGCADLAASRQEPLSDNDKCKDLRQGVVDALDAADGGAACDAITDAPAEGEGEGE